MMKIERRKHDRAKRVAAETAKKELKKQIKAEETAIEKAIATTRYKVSGGLFSMLLKDSGINVDAYLSPSNLIFVNRIVNYCYPDVGIIAASVSEDFFTVHYHFDSDEDAIHFKMRYL